MKELTSVYGAHALRRPVVKKRVGRFQSTKESVGDEARAGWPATACNARNNEKVKWEITKDC